jgi:hypothetical protein
MALVDTVALSPDEGLWTLSLDVVDIDGTALGGSAVATLGNGRVLYYEVKGKYSSKKDRSTLKLKGTGADTGSSIKLKDALLTGSTIESGTITHKILGHRGVYELIP